MRKFVWAFLGAAMVLTASVSADTLNDVLFRLGATGGTTADAAWSGTGSGSQTAIQKAIYAKDAAIATYTNPSFTPTTSALSPVTMTTLGTDYTILASNATRRYLTIQNQSGCNMYIQFGSTAYSAGYIGFKLSVGMSMTYDRFAPNSTIHASADCNAPAYFVLEG